MQRGPGPKAATENPKAATEILRQPPRILRPIDQIHRLICVCACARPCYRWITVRIGPATVQLPLSNAGLPMRPPVPNAGLPCSHRGGHRGGRVLHGGPMRDCPAAVGAACGNPMHAPRRPSALTDAQGRARARPRARVTPHRRRPPPPAPTAKGREWIKKGSMVGSEAGQGRARPCGNGGPTVQGAKAGPYRATGQPMASSGAFEPLSRHGHHARAILRWPWVVARSPVGATCATPREPPGEPATIWTPGGGPKMSTFGQHPGGQTPRADMRPPKGVKMTQK